MRFFVVLLFTVSCLGANLNAIGQPGVLAFEARHGQYVAHGPGYALTVTSGGAVLNLGGHAVRITVAGASPASSLEALDHMPGKANYILGSEVRSSYDLYGRVRRRGVYSGIDLVFRGNQEHLEYDFEVGAGRDPERIKLGFEGVDQLRIDPQGDLVLVAGAVRIHQPKPVAYQLAAGQKQPVDVGYWMDTSHHIRFRTGAYDRRRLLVIDPQIVFEKSFGGSGFSTVAGLARDTQGDLYVAGTTNSPDFPTVNPLQSQLGSGPLLVTANAGESWSYPALGTATSVNAVAFAPSAPLVAYAATPIGVFKSADGGTTWTATAGAGLAGAPTALTVDAGSATTLYSATAQGVFVSTNAGASWQASTKGLTSTSIQVMVAHPSQAGTVFVSTYDPSELFRSTDFGQSWTQLTIAPITQPGQPNPLIYALVVAPNGAIVASTYNQLLISTDGGNTWIAGASQGASNTQALAVAPGSPFTLYLIDSFGVQRSTDGGQTFNVILGTVQTDSAEIAIDPRNPSTLYVTDYNLLERSTNAGQTWSQLALPYAVYSQSISVSPADSRLFLSAFTQTNVFVTKWSADGSQVLYSTYLGGRGGDSASAIAVDGSGSAYVTGSTSSANFPTTAGAFQTKLSGAPNVFVAKLSTDGSQLSYSTLLGTPLAGPLYSLLGTQAPGSYGIAVDNTGNAVITGFSAGNFPVTANAFQATPVPGCYLPQDPTIPTGGAAFVTRIAAGGDSLIYSTFLGGSCATFGTGVALDANGNAWIAGGTLSPDFPVTSDALQPKFGGGYYDGFLARFNPSGGLDYATYLGGSGYDVLNAIALDPSGNIYVTGESSGLSQPAPANAFQPQASASCPVFFIGPSEYYPQGNALVAKLDPTARSIERLTYLGAPLCLSALSIAVDSSGEPWITGPVLGSTVPTADPLEIGIGPGFISKFSADFTQLLFSTYFNSVAGLALDSSGFVYVAGPSGYEVAQAYLAKIDPTPTGAISLNSVLSAGSPSTPSGFSGIAAGEVIRILGKNMGPATATPGVIQAGVLATNVAGVEVTFDGTAVPLLSVSAQEIDLVAPFELAAKSTTTMQVQYNGVPSNVVQVGVTSTAAEVLGVYNADFSANSASNPAQAGSVMSLYLAGAGQTNPPSQDGHINTAPLAAPSGSISITGLDNLPVTFAGAAPGLAAGIFQVNFVAPQQSVMNANLIVGNPDGNPYAPVGSTEFNLWVK